MYLVGLTGGIAAGKSTVAEIWQALGAEIVDADDLAREVVAPGSEGLAKVVSTFGKSILDAEGNLDRKAIALEVFADATKRKQLEDILHPLIKDLAAQRISNSVSEVVVYVIPLLVETNSSLPFDLVVTVEAPELDQVKRMLESRGMTEGEAISRIRAQASPAERANYADRILNSNQSMNLLAADAKNLYHEILKLAEAKRANNAI